MKVSLTNVQLSALTASLPSESQSMAHFGAQFGELEVKRIVNSTGVETVRIAGDLTTGDLCCAAASHLLDRTGTPPGSIDAIVVVTQTPDDLMPGVAIQLQHRLNLSKECVAFDINYGCSGYVYGLYQAAMLIRAGGCRKVLLCTGDVTSKLLNARDRHVRMVFGDAASASLVEPGEGRFDFVIRSDGGGRRHLNTSLKYGSCTASAAQVGYLQMNGTEIMKFALESVPAIIDELLDFCRLGKGDIKLFALHQANGFMLRYLRKSMSLDREAMPVDVRDVGNTGPSSIPLLLSRSAEHVPLAGESVLCGFGVGLSLGAVRIDLHRTRHIHPIDVPNKP
ncbi:MAG TPA: ketoacyl-ACP synthase III [Steroidobacteraceae bacterium]